LARRQLSECMSERQRVQRITCHASPGSWLICRAEWLLTPSFATCWLFLAACVSSLAMGQESVQEFDLYSDDPPTLVGSAQRLMLEQVEQMAAEGDAEEAIAGLEKLFDQGAGFLVPSGAQQRAGTLVAQRYHSLRAEVSHRLGRLLSADADVHDSYRNRHDPVAARVLEDLAISHELDRAEVAAQRYGNTSSGAALYRLLADLYLERGWSIAAASAVQHFVPQLRVELALGAATASDPMSRPASGLSQGTLLWPRVWHANQDSSGDELRDLCRAGFPSDPVGERRLREAIERIAAASELSPRGVDADLWARWIEDLAELDAKFVSSDVSTRMKQASAVARADQRTSPGEDWQTFGGNAARSGRSEDFDSHPERPTWSQRVPLFMASQDLVPASLPRVGEGERETLPYHPGVSDGRLYLNSMTEIQAVELESGDAWPRAVPTRPLFTSGLSSADYLPLGYPLIGTPRATLTVSGGKLFARMGDAVTGRANARVGADGGSLSQLVGLDLDRDGSMLPGFPIRLAPPSFENAEFEGAPVVFGDLLLVAVAVRDSVGLRRSVAAFDVEGGRLRWQSPALATGMVEGSENANLIAHQLLTVSGGRIFYNTNLGNVVCLNPRDGSVLWLTQYLRAPKRTRDIYEPDRFRYRDLNPCLVDQGLVYCVPQDCPEIFALDAATGDLVWASNDAQTQDLIHLIGVTNEALVASGDRLMWLDRRSGRIQGAYPESNSPVRMNGLPQPRGLGRGTVSADRVYWPISGAILVFASQCNQPIGGAPVGEPRFLDRIDLGSRGNDGGNLLASEGMLIYSSAMRIMAFRSVAE
ncbi:MAG: PQQ-binding-like beta-propeller repeat protein, partial [Planctomycetota bacterium]